MLPRELKQQSDQCKFIRMMFLKAFLNVIIKHKRNVSLLLIKVEYCRIPVEVTSQMNEACGSSEVVRSWTSQH